MCLVNFQFETSPEFINEQIYGIWKDSPLQLFKTAYFVHFNT
jgi:hypothetical protein